MKTNWDFTKIHLDRKRPEQLYYQLADEFSKLIEQLKTSGQALPSARQLSEKLGINRATVKKAIDELVRRRLIEPKSPYRYQVSIRSKRSGLQPSPGIGIILPCRFSDLLADSPNALHYLKGIIDATMENRLSTIMLELPDINADQSEVEAFKESLTRQLIGLVHIGGRNHYPDHPLEAVLNHKELPQVFISGIPVMKNVGIVMSDKISGITALAEQLRALNHHRVGIISSFTPGSDAKNDLFYYSEYDRPDFIRRVLSNYGLECDERFHCFNCGSYQTLQKQLREKMKSGNLPTAYCCNNDFTARLCIRVLAELKIKVPEEISVIGFDASPDDKDELTSICQPFYAIGYHSVVQLLDYYENGISERNRIAYLKTFLIAGKTLTQAHNHNLEQITKQRSN